jgi:DNA modification methylase
MFQQLFKKIHAPQERERIAPMVQPIGEFVNKIIHGDCTQVMKAMPSESVDLILTDPPYLANYTSRDGRSCPNDDPHDAWWVKPAYAQMYRLLKPGSFLISFYGLFQVEKFMAAWKAAGFRPVGHFVFVKEYASSQYFTKMHHENAYLLAKQHPPVQVVPPVDVRQWKYTGNELHPTQKAPAMLAELIQAFSKGGDIVLDPFCGSGSTLIAAKALGRRYSGIEIDAAYIDTARKQVGA